MSFEEVLIAAPSYISNDNISALDTSSFTLTSQEVRFESQSPPSPSRRTKAMADIENAHQSDAHQSDEEEPSSGTTKKAGKSRRELPAGAVTTLKAWLLSPEHFTHPYPTPQDQIMLMQQTGIDKKQLKNWFTNARRRIWKPMLKKQLEQGKIQPTASGGGVPTMPVASPGLIGAPNTESDYGSTGPIMDRTQGVQQNYQQVLQQPQSAQQQTYDQYGNPSGFVQPQQPAQYNNQNFYQQGQGQSQGQGQFNQQNDSMASNSIGSLTNMTSSVSNMNKTDSHAVLMELFARDQDLVRRSQERAGGNGHNNEQPQDGTTVQNTLGSQHPMNKIAGGSSTLNKLGNAPSMNSWPHFSSVSSLNNLGTMTGVKSITNMSGADLVSQGSLNRKGNLAQVKSIENFGRADSYAFLEVFFDAPGGSSSTQRGVKREREEDDNVGLSLDGDEGSSPAPNLSRTTVDNTIKSAAPVAAPLPADGQDKEGLKRAYDDALAARGLISVSRSSEKLTDLALPAKMQRTISQEYLKSMNAGTSTTFTTFSFNSNISPPVPAPAPAPIPEAQTQVPLMHPAMTSFQTPHSFQANSSSALTHTNPNASDSVEVPKTTKCALCNCINVDTQLRPCGHMFHGKCLKPSIQNAVGAPRCPIDGTIMVSAVLAVPTDENLISNGTQSPGGIQGNQQQESSSVPGI